MLWNRKGANREPALAICAMKLAEGTNGPLAMAFLGLEAPIESVLII